MNQKQKKERLKRLRYERKHAEELAQQRARAGQLRMLETQRLQKLAEHRDAVRVRWAKRKADRISAAKNKPKTFGGEW